MKINKNSWHYKLVDERCFPATNLCSYFWQVVWESCKGIIEWTIVIVLGTASLLAGLTLLTMPFFAPDMPNEFRWVSAGAWALAGYFLLTVQWRRILPRDSVWTRDLWPARSYTIRKEKPPSLLTEYIKAKKEKICPMLEFVEEDNQ